MVRLPLPLPLSVTSLYPNELKTKISHTHSLILSLPLQILDCFLSAAVQISYTFCFLVTLAIDMDNPFDGGMVRRPALWPL